MSVVFTSNRKNVERWFNESAGRALAAIGERANELTAGNITTSERVETGKMRDSVDYHVTRKNREIVHGIGAFYGLFQEAGTSRGITPGNFIRDSLLNQGDEYRRLLVDEFRGG